MVNHLTSGWSIQDPVRGLGSLPFHALGTQPLRLKTQRNTPWRDEATLQAVRFSKGFGFPFKPLKGYLVDALQVLNHGFGKLDPVDGLELRTMEVERNCCTLGAVQVKHTNPRHGLDSWNNSFGVSLYERVPRT